MKKSASTYLLILLLLILALSAIAAGLSFIIDPSGATVGMEVSMLRHSPFPDFIIPGMFLLVLFGLFPLVILFGLFRKNNIELLDALNIYRHRHWAWTFSYFIGLLLVVWINVQLYFLKEFHILHFVVSMLGVAIIFVSHLPGTKSDYRKTQ
jgi:hypothetical protein